MEIKTVRELAEILNAYGLTRLEVKQEDSGAILTLEKHQNVIYPSASNMPVPAQVLASQESAVQSQAGHQDTAALPPMSKLAESSSYTEIKAPIVGVFYAASSPESPPFVSIGSQVKKGDVLCIIEAMKLMNEVVAEEDGEILDICIKNGDVADYGQVLFKKLCS